MGNAIRSFGAIFLGFGITFLIIGWLGVRYGARPNLGMAGVLAAVGLIGGAILFGAGHMLLGRSTKNAG